MATAPATATPEHLLAHPLRPEGDWRHAFSYHPMNVEIERAEGVYIYDRDGNRYFDASGGPMAVNLPHNHPRMKRAIAAQLENYSYTHPSIADPKRAEFCRLLAEITPGDLDHSYLVSGGSEAVETAIKLARQAQIAMGNRTKYKVISHRDSYHGMTLATLGMSHNPMSQSAFEPMLPKWPGIRQYSDFDRPEGMSREEWGVECAGALEVAIHYAGPKTVAAFLATPHGCGADYACVPPDSYWCTIREICDRYDVFIIADEVVTGFGRTGRWFAMEHFSVDPDMMTMAKGISSCYVPFGAVSVSSRLNVPFEKGFPFVHGFTFGGHPLGCAAGSELIRIADRELQRAEPAPLLLPGRAALPPDGRRRARLGSDDGARTRCRQEDDVVLRQGRRRAETVPVHFAQARTRDVQLALRRLPHAGAGPRPADLDRAASLHQLGSSRRDDGQAGWNAHRVGERRPLAGRLDGRLARRRFGQFSSARPLASRRASSSSSRRLTAASRSSTASKSGRRSWSNCCRVS